MAAECRRCCWAWHCGACRATAICWVPSWAATRRTGSISPRGEWPKASKQACCEWESSTSTFCLCHDIEYVDLSQVIEETIPALRHAQQQGKVRWIGVSGYPMKMFREALDRTSLDVVLSYNHYTLQNTMLADLVPYLKSKHVGILNAAPFSARLLTSDPLPAWHKAPSNVRAVCRQAAEHCRSRGVDLAQLALQFSIRNPDLVTCVTGSANPQRIRQWADWAAAPLDETLLEEVLTILRPVHNWHYTEGRVENNDP